MMWNSILINLGNMKSRRIHINLGNTKNRRIHNNLGSKMNLTSITSITRIMSMRILFLTSRFRSIPIHTSHKRVKKRSILKNKSCMYKRGKTNASRSILSMRQMKTSSLLNLQANGNRFRMRLKKI